MRANMKQQVISFLQMIGLLPQPQLRVVPIRVRRKPLPRRPY